MKKYLFLLILIFGMNLSLNAQNFFFTDNGLKNIKIDEFIYKVEKKYPFEMVGKDLLILKKYNFAFVDWFDYYCLKWNVAPTLLDSSIKLEDIFLAINKTNQIVAIVIFSSSINEEIIFKSLDSVYGGQQLILNSSIGDLQRQKNLWANDYCNVFLNKSNSSEYLKVSIEKKKISIDGPSPFISKR